MPFHWKRDTYLSSRGVTAIRLLSSSRSREQERLHPQTQSLMHHSDCKGDTRDDSQRLALMRMQEDSRMPPMHPGDRGDLSCFVLAAFA